MKEKVLRKFGENIDFISSAVHGAVDLRDNYKLYSKIYRFYTKSGVTFTGDASVDYDIILDYLYEDLSI